MNSKSAKRKDNGAFELIIQARKALKEWRKNNSTGCFLDIKDSIVYARPLNEMLSSHPVCLKISRSSVYRGYGRKRWFDIGVALSQVQKESELIAKNRVTL